MENSRGLLESWARPQQILQPYDHGLSELGLAESKATPVWRRGVYHDVTPTDPLPPPYVRRPVGDGAARSRAHPGLVAALVDQYPASAALPHTQPDLALELARAADGYTRRFGARALPSDWAHPMVRPPATLLAQLEYPDGAPAAPSSPESWRGLPDPASFEARASTALGLWRQCVGAQTSRGRPIGREGDWDVRRPDPCSNPFPIAGSAGRSLVMAGAQCLDACRSLTPSEARAALPGGATLAIHHSVDPATFVARRDARLEQQAERLARGLTVRPLCVCPAHEACHREVVRHAVVARALELMQATSGLCGPAEDAPPAASASPADVEAAEIGAALEELSSADGGAGVMTLGLERPPSPAPPFSAVTPPEGAAGLLSSRLPTPAAMGADPHVPPDGHVPRGGPGGRSQAAKGRGRGRAPPAHGRPHHATPSRGPGLRAVTWAALVASAPAPAASTAATIGDSSLDRFGVRGAVSIASRAGAISIASQDGAARPRSTPRAGSDLSTSDSSPASASGAVSIASQGAHTLRRGQKLCHAPRHR